MPFFEDILRDQAFACCPPVAQCFAYGLQRSPRVVEQSIPPTQPRWSPAHYSLSMRLSYAFSFKSGIKYFVECVMAAGISRRYCHDEIFSLCSWLLPGRRWLFSRWFSHTTPAAEGADLLGEDAGKRLKVLLPYLVLAAFDLVATSGVIAPQQQHRSIKIKALVTLLAHK